MSQFAGVGRGRRRSANGGDGQDVAKRGRMGDGVTLDLVEVNSNCLVVMVSFSSVHSLPLVAYDPKWMK